jgi:hypothetical protein
MTEMQKLNRDAKSAANSTFSEFSKRQTMVTAKQWRLCSVYLNKILAL